MLDFSALLDAYELQPGIENKAETIVHRMQADIKQKMLAFRDASPEDRTSQLSHAHDAIKSIQSKYSDDPAANQLPLSERLVDEARLVSISNFLRYADTLYKLEEGLDKVPFQMDFVMTNTIYKEYKPGEVNLHPEWERFAELKKYIAFPGGPFIKLLKPLREIPQEIFVLFQEAQRAHLTATHKSHIYNLTLDPTAAIPEDQLYPVAIQSFGSLKNKAVDSPQVDANGRVRFLESFGAFLVPGGGQLEVNLTEQDIAPKFLEETLEEQFAEFYLNQRAIEVFNALDPRLFDDTILGIISEAPENIRAFCAQFQQRQDSHTHAQILSFMIRTIDGRIAGLSDKTVEEKEEKRALNELRADLQVQVFKKTDLFQAILAECKENIVVIPVEQLNDTRGMACSQVAYTAITRPGFSIVDIIKRRFVGLQEKAGSDVAGAQSFQYFSPLEAVQRTGQVKFSHDLSAYAASLVCRDKDYLTDETVTETCLQPQSFIAACQALDTFYTASVLPKPQTQPAPPSSRVSSQPNPHADAAPAEEPAEQPSVVLLATPNSPVNTAVTAPSLKYPQLLFRTACAIGALAIIALVTLAVVGLSHGGALAAVPFIKTAVSPIVTYVSGNIAAMVGLAVAATVVTEELATRAAGTRSLFQRFSDYFKSSKVRPSPGTGPSGSGVTLHASSTGGILERTSGGPESSTRIVYTSSPAAAGNTTTFSTFRPASPVRIATEGDPNSRQAAQPNCG